MITGLSNDDRLPLVSVILTTRDRPRFLGLALAYYEYQTYSKRELIVVDDGERFPASEEAVAAVGGRLLRAEPGTPLGTKLNQGVSAARGTFCQKMDDDDWYAPRFLETMVSTLLDNQTVVCQPVVACLMQFLLFDLARWEIRQSVQNNVPGATLLFDRADWEEHAFRALPRDEDVWFLLDQVRSGRKIVPVRAIETFLAVRHRGTQHERDHAWTNWGMQSLEDYLQDRPLYERRPETLLPEWALKAYRELHQELLSNQDSQPGRDDASIRDRQEIPGASTQSDPSRRDHAPGDSSSMDNARSELLSSDSARSSAKTDKVLILTPLKDAADCIDGYCQRLLRLTYPRSCISIGFLEGDSSDMTYEKTEGHLPALRAAFRRVGLWKKDFGYHIPPGVHRGSPEIQIARRMVLAKSRNHLLFHALDDEDWVLWLDVDVTYYPRDLVERLLATGKHIVQPHCVLEYGGATFDTNGWRDEGRLHLDDLRAEGELVELHAVGGTILLARADVHREGLIFPAFLYGRENPRIRKGRGELETEGLGIMAHDMGYQCWGMPNFEVIHQRQ